MAFERVGARAGQRHSRLLERWVGLAELAKLPHSAGGAVEDVEEQRQRPIPDVLPEAERFPGGGRQLQVGERPVEQVLQRVAGHRERIMGGGRQVVKPGGAGPRERLC